MFKKTTPAFRLAFAYLVFSISWILLSDKLVLRLVGNNARRLEQLQSIKGVGFVIFCSLLLYFISRRLYRNMRGALQKSEEVLGRYKALSEATKEGIVDQDLLTDTAMINEQMKFFMSETQNEVQHFSLKHKKRMHPDDFKRVNKNFKDTLETRSNIWQADYRYRMADGAYHDVINKGFIIRSADNKAVRMISVIQDVTEIRNIRTVILQQELKHRDLLGQSMIKAQEDERNRWAEELHDNVCQLLTVVKLYVDQLASESPSPMLVKTREMIIKALNDIRELSASIKPPEFSTTSLRQAIQQLLAAILRVRFFKYELDLDPSDEATMKEEQKLMVYRVVQEQLNNIIKYADASMVRIAVHTREGQAYVEIDDNGKGFDPATASTGIGLRNIRSRLQVFSGNLNIASAPGQGCHLQVNFSLE